MSKLHVLDASAALAYLQQEKGSEQLEAAFDEGPCLMCAVNTCEVMGKLCEKGLPPADAQAVVGDLGLTVVNFDEELAVIAASLRVQTKSIGASLGDRACLALAQRLAHDRPAAIVYTAERLWARLKWPFKIVVIR